MRTSTKSLSTLLCLTVFNAPAFADEKNAMPPKPTQQGMSSMSEEQRDTHLRRVQEYLLANFDFMQKIRETKDEKEQARLKDEWLKAMTHHMNQVPKQLMMHGVPEQNAPQK